LVDFLSELHSLGIDLFLYQQGLETTPAKSVGAGPTPIGSLQPSSALAGVLVSGYPWNRPRFVEWSERRLCEERSVADREWLSR